jgi:predicted naringenin-chalcone synthase
MSTFLHKISTALPKQSYTQTFALETMLRLVGDTEAKRNFLTRIYQSSGIEKRHSVVTDYHLPFTDNSFFPKTNNYLPEPSTKVRNDVFIYEADRLVKRAVEKIIPHLPGGDAESITHLITVSCTGFSAPGFDLSLCKTFGMRGDVERFHIAFMGCFGAFPALRMANHILKANPKAKVLIVNCEICSVHLNFKWDTETQVANALFADGASACFLSGNKKDSTGASAKIIDFYQQLVPQTENEMTWKIGEHGFDMRLSSYIPKVLKENLAALTEPLFKKTKLSPKKIKHWAIHPGGRAILDKLAEAFSLTPSDLSPSYQTLSQYGNMSSVTLFFVLKNILETPNSGPIFSTAFGPGLSVESAIMEI